MKKAFVLYKVLLFGRSYCLDCGDNDTRRQMRDKREVIAMSTSVTTLVLVLTWLLLGLAAAYGAEETRVALVIGNDKYEKLPNLNNATRDAEAMADKLVELGFETISRLNITEFDLHRTLDEFETMLRRSEVGLIYYAGHGIQTEDGRNYLIPADAQIESTADLRSQAVLMSDLLETMARAGSDLNIVILDACRDNPLPLRSVKRGLAMEVVPAGIRGSAIVFSASPGQAAQDGPEGGHGIFTGELLKALDEPGLTLEQVFKRVNKGVRESTDGSQRPWTLTSLEGDFFFNPATVTDNGGGIAEDVVKELLRALREHTDEVKTSMLRNIREEADSIRAQIRKVT